MGRHPPALRSVGTPRTRHAARAIRIERSPPSLERGIRVCRNCRPRCQDGLRTLPRAPHSFASRAFRQPHEARRLTAHFAERARVGTSSLPDRAMMAMPAIWCSTGSGRRGATYPSSTSMRAHATKLRLAPLVADQRPGERTASCGGDHAAFGGATHSRRASLTATWPHGSSSIARESRRSCQS